MSESYKEVILSVEIKSNLMGNQLTAIAPTQIYPVEHYFKDLPDLTFKSNLGSTRFFKVALAKSKEGLVVVKVFANHDPLLNLQPYKQEIHGKLNSFPHISLEGLVVVKVFANHDPLLNLQPYKQEIHEIRYQLLNGTNCLPFQDTIPTDKAGLLIRQYVKYNLYDRISTRPFLNNMEKKWIAFQLMCAINQCHKSNIYHGDIKLENIMVTSWHWVFLTDFASFKPTYLPQDNPADYSFFFDTSRRRICYISPERFVKSFSSESSSSASTLLPGDEIVRDSLTCAMDVFSVGCSIVELFTEGTPPFDFSQLLSYREGDYSPWKVIEMIKDTSIREMTRHMLQKDPTLRYPIEEYLEQQRGKAFPEYFYSFLKVYIQQFSSSGFNSMYSSDDKIEKLKNDMKNIIKVICGCEEDESDTSSNCNNTEGLVIIVSLLTSMLRSLKQCRSKLDALDMMKILAKYTSSDIILDRLMPHICHFLKDAVPRVRAAAIHTLSRVLSLVKVLPRSDVDVFLVYVIPHLTPLLDDSAVFVRMEYARNIASLAETGLRFLEMAQSSGGFEDLKNYNHNDLSHDPFQTSYDLEFQDLQEKIQKNVFALVSDPENVVKQTLLQNGITRLCVFFGQQKANDLLLSHIITFLNHKQDRSLREAFFDCIVGVAAYIGWQSGPILKPLIQQGMSDSEESVVCKALETLTSLTELGLISKAILFDLLNDTTLFLCHPNLWIRQAAVGFICTVSSILDIVDVHCKIQPAVKPFLKNSVIQLDKELVLLSSLDEPIPRATFDYLVLCPMIAQLFDHLEQRKLLRTIKRPGHQTQYSEIGPMLTPIFRRLRADGMTEATEDKILVCLSIQHVYAKNENLPASTSNTSSSVVTLAHVSSVVTRRYAPLIVTDNKEGSTASNSARKQVKKKTTSLDSPNIVMNKEWQHMFGSSDQRAQSPKIMSNTDSSTVPKSTSSINVSNTDVVQDQKSSNSSVVSAIIGKIIIFSFKQMYFYLFFFHVADHYAECKRELQELIYRKREQYKSDTLQKECVDNFNNLNSASIANWHPKGKLVAHLHEHRGAVNRIRVIPETTLFASCSNDGTVRVWDCGRMEGKSVANRSRQTYDKQEGEITALAVCKSNQCLASASDLCSIHVVQIEANSPKMVNVQSRTLDPQEDGCVVDMNHIDAGSQSILAYATTCGSIVGWDLRAPGNAWKFENNQCHGLITSFCIDPRHCWLVAGTSNGTIVCWDLRFQIPLSKISHPSGSMVTKLLIHPNHESFVISAFQHHNEVSIWNMETGGRQTTLWASPAPPLSHTEGNKNAVRAMYIAASAANEYDRNGPSYLLTAGTDKMIRYWDLQNPLKSYIVTKPAIDQQYKKTAYRPILIEGVTVVQETYSEDDRKNRVNSEYFEDGPRSSPEMPPSGHYDTISDLEMLQTSQKFLISSSKDGVIKVWK
ncbi:Phosphoinositide 3-kinase regulatory subunit 4 [Nymphon striatum]|nr:Phosphoinositide 3-kinase regulatory subunit 4 [Nymphon striatum]